MSGFVYSKAFERPIERVPVIGEGEEETGIHWYPEVSWEQGEKQKTVAERLFNMETVSYTHLLFSPPSMA